MDVITEALPGACPRRRVSATAARPTSRPGVPYAKATIATFTTSSRRCDAIVVWESTLMSDDELHVYVPFGFLLLLILIIALRSVD